MLKFLVKQVFGSPNSRYLKNLSAILNEINSHKESVARLLDEDFPKETEKLRAKVNAGYSLDEILPYAYALVREASKRSCGMWHYDVQVLGALALHKGQVAEMGTGEGKTLVATMPAFLNSLTGHGVHIVTVNDYLAERDSIWMKPIYDFMGVTVAAVSSATTNEDRRAAYSCDIVYVTNTEITFDFLRDNMVMNLNDKVQGQLNFAIVDEADSVLIDNARTPVVISGPVSHDATIYAVMNNVAQQLTVCTDADESGDFRLDEQNKQAFLTESGHDKAEIILQQQGVIAVGSSLYDAANINYIHHLNAALKANYLFNKDVEYVVQDGQIVVIDELSGRAMSGRRWGDGIHQAVESKEGVEIKEESQTLASVTFQNYFRLYRKIAGMTGTAETEAYELQDVYGLGVVAIPANKVVNRRDMADIVFLTKEKKYEAIIEDIKASHSLGQPILVGTVSIEDSELLSSLLSQHKIKHNVLNAKQHEQEAAIIADAGCLNAVTIATNMAGRGTDIVLGGNIELQLASAQSEEERATIKKNWLPLQQQVITLGGLKIIGTERHESRRIDNQLRGRCGRQGDPGVTQFYLSLEDNLMRIFASEKIQELMKRLGMQADDTISAPMLNRAIENAQRKVEGHNFDIRKQLLQFDDIANDQRKVIFSERFDLLNLTDIADIVEDMRITVVGRVVDSYALSSLLPEEWNLSQLQLELAEEYAVSLPIQQWFAADDAFNKEKLKEKIIAAMLANYAEKELLVGAETMREFEKMLMLQVIDQQWKEHLATMDHLRHGIHLRGYAQRNPIQEYKKESFEIFSKLLDHIKFETIKKLQIVRINNAEKGEDGKALDPAMFAGIRRNDNCPCNSGLKYKHCHGKITTV